MTKILWVPQLSFIDKQTHKFLLDSDSNIAFLRRLLPIICEEFPNWDIDLMLPDHLDSPDLIHPEYLHKIKAQKLFIPDAFLGRIHFPVQLWKRVLNLTEPDILWLNTLELVQNFTTLREKMGLKFKIVTYNHWVDLIDIPRVPEAMNYLWRQTEGTYKNDVALFNSNFIIEKFLNSTRSFFGNSIANTLQEKCLPLYIPWKKKESIKNKKINSKVSIMWSQRLSLNSFYNEDKLFWWKLFEKYSKQLDVSVSNPSGFPKLENVSECGMWDYNEFLKKLANADLSFGPMQSPIQWSLNLCDSLEVDTPAFLIYKDAFKEMLWPEYPFGSIFKEGLVQKFEALFTDNRIWELRERSKDLTRYFRFNDETVKEQLRQVSYYL